MDRLSLKDVIRFKDISWLMPQIDVRGALSRLGSHIEKSSNREIRAFCPDHHVFTGTSSSHPNWTVNIKTGETFCFTEGRGSNLVFVVCRALDCGTKDAVSFLTGNTNEMDVGTIRSLSLLNTVSKMRQVEEERPPVQGLETIVNEMNRRTMSQEAYQFFIHAPGKKYPTNILPDTVDRYWVFERTWGFYSNRVIIPFTMRGFVVGFCALDILGKEAWLRKNPLKTEDEYRKIRYPLNFMLSNCLFGFDDCEKGCDVLVITEGARDVMKLWQEGFTNAVAIGGAYLSDNQMLLITELGPKMIALMFDGDKAGKSITERLTERLSKSFSGNAIKQCFVPNGKDPKNLMRDDFNNLIWG